MRDSAPASGRPHLMRNFAKASSAWSLALCIVLVGCQNSTESGDPVSLVEDGCAAHEVPDYPVLEEKVTQLLESTSYSLTRMSSCEDTGQPHASVAAKIPEWKTRAQAVEYLKQKDWTRDPSGTTWTSEDGDFVAQVIMGTEPDGGPRFTDLRISRPSE